MILPAIARIFSREGPNFLLEGTRNRGVRNCSRLGAFARVFSWKAPENKAGADTRTLAHLVEFHGGLRRSVSKYSP